MDISVQICTHNRKELLKRCLEAVFKQNYPADKFEVVLTDDGSTDGTAEMVQALKPPCGFHYIYQQKSSLASGRNKGIRKAIGNYILFIDDDIIAHPDLLKEHIRYHKKYFRSVVKGWVNHVDNLERLKNPVFNWLDFSTAFFWTSNVSVERKYLLQVGLFDESFTEYGWEDLEIGLRLRKISLVSRFNKKALVYHYKSPWSKERLESALKISQSKGRTAGLFRTKHPGLRTKIATGDYFLRFLLNDLLYLKGYGAKFCKKIVDKSDSVNFKGLSLFCAKRLIDFEYFNALRTSKIKP